MAPSLENFIRSNPNPRELKRAIAVKMALEQYTHKQICTILGVTSGFVSKWKKQYLAHSVDSLRLAHRGSQPYLSTQQRE